MHLGKEMVDKGRIQAVYKEAEGMHANSFSKPYEPVRHKPFKGLIQGEHKRGQQAGAMKNGERKRNVAKYGRESWMV
jgi:hypothetical protein